MLVLGHAARRGRVRIRPRRASAASRRGRASAIPVPPSPVVRGPLEVVGELGGDAAVVAEHAIRLLDLLELLGGGVLMRDVRVVAEAQAAEGAFQDFAVGGFL